MQIQTHTGGLQAVAQHSDAAAGVGKFGQLDARQVATSQDALQLGSRSEPQKGQGLLSRLGAQLARPFVALKEWIGNLLGARPAAPARSAPPADNLSLADQKRLLLQKALPFTLGGLDKASELNNIAAQQLGTGTCPAGDRQWRPALAGNLTERDQGWLHAAGEPNLGDRVA